MESWETYHSTSGRRIPVIQRYFGELKVFGAVDELVSMVTGGVPVNTAATDVDLERALQYGSHLSVIEHLPTILKKIGDDVRRQKCLATQKSAAHEITNHRASQLAVVATHNARILNDSSFAERSRENKGGLSGDADPNTVPQRLCAQALPTFVDELVTLRKCSLERGY